MKVDIGDYNEMTVLRKVPFGLYLDDGKDGLLLPQRFVPEGVEIGDSLMVFVYHDGEDRLIATTQQPKGKVGDIVRLKVVSVNQSGAFLDNGLMKDLFVPNSKMRNTMKPGFEYLVYIYLDLETRRMTATEKFDYVLSNQQLTVQEKDQVIMVVYRRTDIGYVVIINNLHTGILHFSDIFSPIRVGDRLKGYIRKIYEDNLIDVGQGEMGYVRVDKAFENILSKLKLADGFLPYGDKTPPEVIYEAFGMSKKTFKMAIGKMYKEKMIELRADGICLSNPKV